MRPTTQMATLRYRHAMTNRQWTEIVYLCTKPNRRPIANGKVPRNEYPGARRNMDMLPNLRLETTQ